MAISEVQTANAVADANVSSLDAVYGVTPTEGNLLVAIAARRNNGGLAITGWSTAYSHTNGSFGDMWCFYKIAGSSESATVTVDLDTSQSGCCLQLAEYSGVDESTPFDVKDTNDDGGSTPETLSTGTTATTSQANQLWVGAVGVRAVDASSWSWDNSFTHEDDIYTAGSGDNLSLGWGTRLVTSTGAAQSDASWTGSGNCTGGIATFNEAAAGSETLTADPGSLTLTGATADLTQQLKLTADPGSLTLTGAAADLTQQLRLTADPGSLTLTGAAADLIAEGDVSAALTGTAIAGGLLEGEVRDGGETIIITLTDGTWVTAFTFNGQRQGIIDGLESDGVEAAGWDAEVKAKLPVTDVVRTSDTVVTITMTAQAGYLITADETITVTIPTDAQSGTSPVVATPTFDVTNETPVSLTADPGSLTLTGAAADLIAAVDYVLTADPGSLTLTGGEATLTDSGSIIRRGGRFIFDKEPEPEPIAELIELVHIEPEPAKVAQGSSEPIEAMLGIKGRVSIAPGKKSRVDRLLRDAGLTLDELLVIISM